MATMVKSAAANPAGNRPPGADRIDDLDVIRVIQSGAITMDQIFVPRSHTVSTPDGVEASSEVPGGPENIGRGGGI
jgi:hypothetical protein